MPDADWIRPEERVYARPTLAGVATKLDVIELAELLGELTREVQALTAIVMQLHEAKS